MLVMNIGSGSLEFVTGLDERSAGFDRRSDIVQASPNRYRSDDIWISIEMKDPIRLLYIVLVRVSFGASKMISFAHASM